MDIVKALTAGDETIHGTQKDLVDSFATFAANGGVLKTNLSIDVDDAIRAPARVKRDDVKAVFALLENLASTTKNIAPRRCLYDESEHSLVATNNVVLFVCDIPAGWTKAGAENAGFVANPIAFYPWTDIVIDIAERKKIATVECKSVGHTKTKTYADCSRAYSDKFRPYSTHTVIPMCINRKLYDPSLVFDAMSMIFKLGVKAIEMVEVYKQKPMLALKGIDGSFHAAAYVLPMYKSYFDSWFVF